MTDRLPHPQGLAFRADRDAMRRDAIISFMRACTGAAIGTLTPHVSASEALAKRWPQDRDAAVILKAATSPASTISAAAIAPTLIADLLAVLAPVSAAAALLGEGLKLRFDGAAAISVPSFVADANNASFVAEGAAIPVRQLVVGAPTALQPHKLAVISVLSFEMVASSNAQRLVTDVLSTSIALALDKYLFDSLPADASRPAGLRNGIAALTASTAPDHQRAALEDVDALVQAVSAIGGDFVLVAAPGRAVRLQVHLRDVPSLTILASRSLAANDVIAVAPAGLISAAGNAPTIEANKESLLHMDSVPGPIVDGGGMSAPARSLFQTDAVALKLRLPVSWGLRANSAVAWLSAAGW